MQLRLPPPAASRAALRGAALRPRSFAVAPRPAPPRAARATADDAADADDAAAPPTMRKRRLIVLRHADAEPRRAAEADASRALSARGKLEARAVARQLVERAKWLPDLILTSDSARSRQTLAEMCASAPELAQARVVALPALYAASGSGADAVAALTAALTRHAAPGDATALLLGHNPGWEEAVALLTCREAGEALAEGADALATAEGGDASAVRLRSAHGALLRSEQRSWRDALAGGWARRGAVAPRKPAPKAQHSAAPLASQPPPRGTAQHATFVEWCHIQGYIAEKTTPALTLHLEAAALGLAKLQHAQHMLRSSAVAATAAQQAGSGAAERSPEAMSDEELTIAIADAEAALPPLPRDMCRALGLTPHDAELGPITAARAKRAKRRPAGEGKALSAAELQRRFTEFQQSARQSEHKVAQARAAGAPDAGSFAHFYERLLEFTAAELAEAHAALDRFLALKPEMLRRMVDRQTTPGDAEQLREVLQWGGLPLWMADDASFRAEERRIELAGDSRKQRELRWTGYVLDAADIKAARAARQAESHPVGIGFQRPRPGSGLPPPSAAGAQAPAFGDVERWWAEQSGVKRGKLRARVYSLRRAAADPHRIALAVAQFWKAEAMAAEAQRAKKPAAPSTAAQSLQPTSTPPAAQPDHHNQPPAPGAAPAEPPRASPAAAARKARGVKSWTAGAYAQPPSAPRPGESVTARARREAAEAAAAAAWALECMRAAWQSDGHAEE